jgi:transposase
MPPTYVKAYVKRNKDDVADAEAICEAVIRRAAAPSFSPLAALRSSEAVRSSRVIDTAAPIDAAPLSRASIESEFP